MSYFAVNATVCHYICVTVQAPKKNIIFYSSFEIIRPVCFYELVLNLCFEDTQPGQGFGSCVVFGLCNESLYFCADNTRKVSER